MAIDATLHRLGDALITRIDEMLEGYVARIRDEVPEFFASNDPTVVEATRESARANYVVAFEALRAGREMPNYAPAAAAEEVRMAAQMGISIGNVLRTYYVGHSIAWDFILTEVERLDLDPRTRTAVLQLTSRYSFAYMERISVLVTDEYARARLALLRSSDRRRMGLVRDLLEGLPGNGDELGYALGGWHLAAIAWGNQPEAALAELARVLSGPALTIDGPLTTLWGWLATNERDIGGRLESYASPPDTRIALGAPGHGRAGFRRSHEQALEARVVALRTAESVTRWQTVALEALALHDEKSAQTFVHEELGLLAGGDRRTTVLRQTLAAWFQAEHHAAAAATLLGVHERTVTYRLRSIEERLGYPILKRRTELDAALRLHDHCGLRERR